MKRIIAFFALILLFGADYAVAGTWTTLDYGGAWKTYATGVNGGNIVGYYDTAPPGPGSGAKALGFIYDGITWTGTGTPRIYGIDGDYLVGGTFLYNMTTQTSTMLYKPGGGITQIHGINGNNVVGYYNDAAFPYNSHGFIYDITSENWTTIDKPGAIETIITDMDGSSFVGGYTDASGSHDFLYDGTDWITLDKPGAYNAGILGIDGSNLVGLYYDYASGPAHGFLYNLESETWKTLDMPGAYSTYIQDIDGNKIVGYYDNATGTHGFVYEIPEPATIALLVLGGLFLRGRKT